MSVFLKKPYIPPPFKDGGNSPLPVFHYAQHGVQQQTVPSGTSMDIAVDAPTAIVAHTGVISVEPLVYQALGNQYVRVGARLRIQVHSPVPLTGCCIAVRIGQRDVLFSRESSRHSTGNDTSYDFQIEGCLYLRKDDLVSLVFRAQNDTPNAVTCLMMAGQFAAELQQSLLGALP